MNSSVSDTFWIDKETFVALKAEQNVGPKGTTVYEVSSVAYDITLADSLFQYTPPAGARQLSDPAAVKQALAGPAK
jgi:outer membrane lipoprotein-sorting protein